MCCAKASTVSEKTLPSSRFLLSLTVFSMLFLVSSSFFLFHSVEKPFIPSSVYNMIVIESESDPVGGKSKPNIEPIDHNVVPLAPLAALSTANASKEDEIPVEARVSPNLNEKTSPTLANDKTDDLNKAVLKLYMYDLPPEFHFGLLDWKPEHNEIWPDVSDPNRVPRYPGGLNLQHSIEYWLTLDLLSSNVKEIVRPGSAIRVQNPSEADFIFVPFFASLSYNRHSKVVGKGKFTVNRRLQNKLVEFLLRQPEWKKSGGKDHIIVAHHPNSMLYARKKLGSARFVLADFGRYASKVANVEKDVIAPYKHVVRSISNNESAPFEQRPVLAYFQGAIYRKDGGAIRQELYYLLKDEEDVHFTFGSAIRSGVRQASQGMGTSKFCLNIAGDTPSSNRLFDAIVSHCVPVIISDDIELPYEDVLDYSQFSIFVWASDAVKKGFLLKLLRGITKDEWTKMWEKLKEVAHHFEFQYPSQPGDAVDMIWQAIARKKAVVNVNHKERMYRTPQLLMKGR